MLFLPSNKSRVTLNGHATATQTDSVDYNSGITTQSESRIAWL